GEDPEKATEPARRTFGYDYETFARQTVVGTPEQIAERIQARVDVGINYIIVSFPRIAYDHEPLYRFAEEIAPHIH
ncbi:MAG: LLM class F420-dependent oxidoreductase, partial [Ktedonobacterales bacterium]